MIANVVVAARVKLYINGKPFGQVTSFSYSIGSAHKEMRGIDSLEPYELAPTMTAVSGAIGVIKTTGDGALEGPGITTQLPNLPRQKYITLMLVDTATDTPLFQADYAVVTGQNWDAGAKSIVQGQFTFSALTWSNEAPHQ